MNNISNLNEIYEYIENVTYSGINFNEISLKFHTIVDILDDKDLKDIKKANMEANIFSNKIKDGTLSPTSSVLVNFNEEYYNHIIERLDTTNNPFLKSQYATILWLSPKKLPKYALIAISSFLEQVEIYEKLDLNSPSSHFGLYVIDSIKNAFFLSLQIRNSKLVKTKIIKLIFYFNSKSSSSFVLRAKLIDLMLSKRQVFSKEDFEGIEKICFDLGNDLKNNNRVLNAITIFELGEKVERKTGRNAYNWKLFIAESYENLMQKSIDSDNPNWTHFWLKAHNAYKRINDKTKIKELKKKYTELKTSLKFAEISENIDLTDQIRIYKDFVDKLIEKNSDEIINCLTFYKPILPTYIESENQAEIFIENSLGTKLVSAKTIVDSNGNESQHFTTEEEKRYYQILFMYGQILEVCKMPLIKLIFIESIKHGKLNTSILLDFFQKNTWFGKTFLKKFVNDRVVVFNWLTLLAPSINEFFIQMELFVNSSNYPNLVLPIDSLTLKFEGLLRNFCSFCKIDTFKIQHVHDNQQITIEKDLNALLHEKELENYFDQDDLLFLKFLLIEKAGYNLRHNVAHSFMVLENYNMNYMFLLILALLKLGKFDLGNNNSDKENK